MKISTRKKNGKKIWKKIANDEIDGQKKMFDFLSGFYVKFCQFCDSEANIFHTNLKK